MDDGGPGGPTRDNRHSNPVDLLNRFHGDGSGPPEDDGGGLGTRPSPRG